MQFMLMFWPGFSMAVQSDQDAAQSAQCMLKEQSKRQMLQIQTQIFVKPTRNHELILHFGGSISCTHELGAQTVGVFSLM